AADEKPGLEACFVEQPCAHRRGRRFAVRARDHERTTPDEEALAERGRHRRAREAELFGARRFGVGFADRVADDDEVEVLVDLRGVVTLEAADACRRERWAHRRIERRVGPAHLVPGVTEQRCELTHSRPADAHEVYTHRTESIANEADVN